MKTQSKNVVLHCALLLAIVFAATSRADEAKSAGADISLAAAAKEILRANCAECHSDEDARADVRVLDHAALVASDYIVPHKPDESMLYQLITSTDDDSMPPKTRPALTTEQIAYVRKWIASGAETFPADAQSENATSTDAQDVEEPDAKDATDTNVLQTILKHVRETSKSDRPFLRYFSMRHLLVGGITPQRLQDHRLAFTKAINHLSREREIVVPQAIDKLQSVLVVDVRELGWHRKKLRDVDNEAFDLNVYDLVLLEYPFAIIPVDSDTFDELENEFLKPAAQVRPIPFVRTDWFCSVVLQPPMYHDMLQLPLTLNVLETSLDVDVEGNLKTDRAERAGMTISGVSRNNRAVERHPHRDGYYWKSHDFQSNIGSENILKNPLDFVPSGGEMIFRLPNGTQGYYVSDGRGNRLDAAPTSIVVDKFASDRVVRNGLGCIRCHTAGIKDFSDTVRDVVKALPGNPGFDKRKTLRLYSSRETWDKTIADDRALFSAALEKMGESESRREPLAVVTSDYLEGSLTLTEAAAELNVDSETLRVICSSPGFTRLGLAPLASGGVIRRDAWEDNFDAATTKLGAGVPVVAIDGNTRREYVPDPTLDKIELRSNKPNNFFEPGDELRVTVENKSGANVFLELYGTSIEGQKVRLTDGVIQLDVGASFSFPQSADQAIEIRGGIGREEITMFASTSEFRAGQIYRGEHIADRVVHNFYVRDVADKRRDVADVVKKTILIETK